MYLIPLNQPPSIFGEYSKADGDLIGLMRQIFLLDVGRVIDLLDQPNSSIWASKVGGVIRSGLRIANERMCIEPEFDERIRAAVSSVNLPSPKHTALVDISHFSGNHIPAPEQTVLRVTGLLGAPQKKGETGLLGRQFTWEGVIVDELPAVRGLVFS